MKSTAEILRLLRAANPGRHVTEDLVRACLRRGDVAPPCLFAGRYAWAPSDVQALAAALRLHFPGGPWDVAPAPARSPSS